MTETETAARARELCESIDAHRKAIVRESTERRMLVTVLHKQFGLTTRQIGPVLGISYARVAQIISGRRRR